MARAFGLSSADDLPSGFCWLATAASADSWSARPALAWRFSPLRIITSPRATQKIMPAQQDAPLRDVKRLTDIQLPPPRLCCGSGHTLPLASRPARQRTASGPAVRPQLETKFVDRRDLQW